MQHDEIADQLDAYARARRLLAVAQGLLLGLAVHVVVGVWQVTLLTIIVLPTMGAVTWRKGGWSYERASSIWKRNPKVRKRDLAFMRPLIGLLRRE